MKASSIFLVIFGLLVSSIGGLFTSLMWNSYQKASDMHAWPKVEALILSSEINERQVNEFSPKEYRIQLLYGYQWQGQRKTSDRIVSRGSQWAKELARSEKQLEKYPAGLKTWVYVNPTNPDFTVLKPDTKAAGYSIWFPLLFVVGGLGVSWKAILVSFKPSFGKQA